MDRIFFLSGERQDFLSGRGGQDFFRGETDRISLRKRLDSFRKSHLICFLFGYLCMQTLFFMVYEFYGSVVIELYVRDCIELN